MKRNIFEEYLLRSISLQQALLLFDASPIYEVIVLGIDPCVARLAISYGHASASSFFTSIAYSMQDLSAPLLSRSLVSYDDNFTVIRIIEESANPPRSIGYRFRVRSFQAAVIVKDFFCRLCRAAGATRDPTVMFVLFTEAAYPPAKCVNLEAAAVLTSVHALESTRPSRSGVAAVCVPLLSTAAVAEPRFSTKRELDSDDDVRNLPSLLFSFVAVTAVTCEPLKRNGVRVVASVVVPVRYCERR